MNAYDVQVGQRYWFNPDSGLPTYIAHRDQIVQVTRFLGTVVEDDTWLTQFEIKADDGWQGIAFAHELTKEEE